MLIDVPIALQGPAYKIYPRMPSLPILSPFSVGGEWPGDG